MLGSVSGSKTGVGRQFADDFVVLPGWGARKPADLESAAIGELHHVGAVVVETEDWKPGCKRISESSVGRRLNLIVEFRAADVARHSHASSYQPRCPLRLAGLRPVEPRPRLTNGSRRPKSNQRRAVSGCGDIEGEDSMAGGTGGGMFTQRRGPSGKLYMRIGRDFAVLGHERD